MLVASLAALCGGCFRELCLRLGLVGFRSLALLRRGLLLLLDAGRSRNSFMLALRRGDEGAWSFEELMDTLLAKFFSSMGCTCCLESRNEEVLRPGLFPKLGPSVLSAPSRRKLPSFRKVDGPASGPPMGRGADDTDNMVVFCLDGCNLFRGEANPAMCPFAFTQQTRGWRGEKCFAFHRQWPSTFFKCPSTFQAYFERKS